MSILISSFLAGAAVWGTFIYNRLVRDRNRVSAAWGDVFRQIKRRHDLIPKLLEALRQYTGHESASLEAVTELCSRSEREADVGEIGSLESDLGTHLRRLLAVAESSADLKADRSFLDLQHHVAEVENDLRYARRYYNGAVRNLNVRIDSFPDLLIAHLFRYRPAQFFELGKPSHTRAVGAS